MTDHRENMILAAKAFSKQADVFDSEYANDVIVNYKRERVREHLEKQLKPNSNILELNSGTGEDAVYLSKRGHRIHCTDISENMLAQIEKKIHDEKVNDVITAERRSFLELNTLHVNKKYDHIFSNFGGLNTTHELNKVLNSFSDLLTEDGGVTLVIMPKFCLWENLLALKGNFKTAFRRYNKNGAPSHIEGIHFTSWYYSPKYVISHLKENFEVCCHQGLCALVPPSYLKDFPMKFPGLFNFLLNAEKKHGSQWPWKNCGDYFIISLRKKKK